MVGLPQEESALLHPPGDEIINGRSVKLPAEGVGQVILVHMGQLSQLVQAQIFLKVVVDVPPHQGALPAALWACGIHLQVQPALPLQADQDHLQQMAAGLLVAGPGVPDLPEHQLQAGHQLPPAAVQVEHGVPVRAPGGLQPLHPQHDVLQRAVQLAQLGVEHVGVDDNQVVDGYGKLLILGAEPAVAVGDEEQLRAAVGVEVGVPLLGILRPGQIAQPQRLPAGRRGRRPGKTVLVTAHAARLPLRNFTKIL